MKAVELEELLEMAANGMGHGVVAVGFVEDAFPVGGGGPALGADHEGADVGKANLHCGDEQVAHEVNVLVARQVLGGALDLRGGEFGFHIIDLVHARLDGAHGIEVFAKLRAVAGAEAALQGAGVFQREIGDVACACVALRAK